MKTIDLIARIGDQTLAVGKCTSAQARILVKQNHAAWQDGKLLLPLNPELLQMAVNHPQGPLDDANVSKKEMERRVAWLGLLLNGQAQARAEKKESRIDQIVAHSYSSHILAVLSSEQVAWSEDPTDLVEWYDTESKPLVEAATDRGRAFPRCMDGLWETDPDLHSGRFGLPAPSKRTDIWPPLPAGQWLEMQMKAQDPNMEEPKVVESPAFHPAKWPKCTIVDPQRGVDSMKARPEILSDLFEKN